MNNFIPTRKSLAGFVSAALIAVTVMPPAQAFGHERKNASVHYGHGTHINKRGHRQFHYRYGPGYNGTQAFQRTKRKNWHGHVGHGYRHPGYNYRQPAHPVYKPVQKKPSRTVYKHTTKKSDKGDLIAAGIIGLAIGAVIAGSASKRKSLNSYNQPYSAQSGSSHIPLDNYRSQSVSSPQVITYNDPVSLQPWSQGWYEWCDNNYRSFNRNTGTFRGYDGLDHFCVPK